MVLQESIVISNPLDIQLSNKVYLYSMAPGKFSLPVCSQPEYTMRTGDANRPKQIVLDSTDNELAILQKADLNKSKCPTSSQACPFCDEMEDQDLEDLICSSDKGNVFKILK